MMFPQSVPGRKPLAKPSSESSDSWELFGSSTVTDCPWYDEMKVQHSTTMYNSIHIYIYIFVGGSALASLPVEARSYFLNKPNWQKLYPKSYIYIQHIWSYVWITIIWLQIKTLARFCSHQKWQWMFNPNKYLAFQKFIAFDASQHIYGYNKDNMDWYS